jgi:hypothetical protein
MSTLFRRTIYGEYTERTDHIATLPMDNSRKAGNGRWLLPAGSMVAGVLYEVLGR